MSSDSFTAWLTWLRIFLQQSAACFTLSFSAALSDRYWDIKHGKRPRYSCRRLPVKLIFPLSINTTSPSKIMIKRKEGITIPWQLVYFIVSPLPVWDPSQGKNDRASNGWVIYWSAHWCFGIIKLVISPFASVIHQLWHFTSRFSTVIFFPTLSQDLMLTIICCIVINLHDKCQTRYFPWITPSSLSVSHWSEAH